MNSILKFFLYLGVFFLFFLNTGFSFDIIGPDGIEQEYYNIGNSNIEIRDDQ
jgi:hypothetical protein